MTDLERAVAAHREALGHLADLERARDDAIRAALAEGASLRKVADIVGLSFQRVAQIAKADRS